MGNTNESVPDSTSSSIVKCSCNPSSSSSFGVFDIDRDLSISTTQSQKHLTNIDLPNPNIIISSKVIKTAADFWCSQIDLLSMSDQLEIGVSICLSMTTKDISIQKIINKHCKEIEKLSLKLLNMISWLIRSLINNNNNNELYESLSKLGILHKNMDININHFDPMLEALHETLNYYFPTKYKLQEQYAIDCIIRYSAEIMMNETYNPFLNDIATFCNKSNIEIKECSKSLQNCLNSTNGREYLYKYLKQFHCEEIVIYLQLIKKFKSKTSDKERYMIGNDIINKCIYHNAPFSLNISYECRQKTLKNMKKLKHQFHKKQKNFIVSLDLFENVELEMRRLIIKNHWRNFVDDMQNMQQ